MQWIAVLIMAHYMNSSWQPMRKLTVILIVLPLVLMARATPGESSAPVDPGALLESMAAYLLSLDSFTLYTEKVFDDVLSTAQRCNSPERQPFPSAVPTAFISTMATI